MLQHKQTVTIKYFQTGYAQLSLTIYGKKHTSISGSLEQHLDNQVGHSQQRNWPSLFHRRECIVYIIGYMKSDIAPYFKIPFH